MDYRRGSDSDVSHRLPYAEGRMKEFDSVVLRRALPDAGLEEGDVGAIVHCHNDASFEVEFISGEGGTLAVLTLNATDVLTIQPSEILHVRSLAHR
jgi:Domain of unknown function (DUF4926)